MDSHSKRVIEISKELLRHFGYFVDKLWHVNDVHLFCEENALPEISDAEAMEIFAIAKEQFDGEIGLSWPALGRAVYSFFQIKESVKENCDAEFEDAAPELA